MKLIELKSLSFSYLECNMENLFPVIVKIWNDNKHSILTDMSLSDINKIEQLPGGAHFEKIIFYQVHESGCIMISNYADGMESMTHIISSKLDAKILNFRLSSVYCLYPVNSLSCIKNGKMQRAIYALKENKWQFYNCGDPLWFESPENYKNRVIKNRINAKILIDYCAKLKLNITDSSFWKSDNAVVIERLMW